MKTTNRILKINSNLKAKGFKDADIDKFWANIFRLAPKIEKVGIANIKICTGCGHLDIDLIQPPALACCPDSHYVAISPIEDMEVEYTEVKPNTKIIYLAGKISGESLTTCTMKFGAAQHHWQAKGYEVLNPLQIVNGWKTPWQEAMRYCIQALCMATHIYFLSDWSQSKGAKIEHQLAKDLGIKIIYQKK